MKNILKHPQRGAALVVVLGLLMLVVFIMLGLSYLIMIEGQSGSLYGRQVQARYDAGLASAGLLSTSTAATSATMSTSAVLKAVEGNKTDTGVVESIDDLSGRVNVNYVRDAEAFDRFVRSVFEQATISDKNDAKAAAVAKEKVALAGTSPAGTATKKTSDLTSPDERVFPPYGRMLISVLDVCRKQGASIEKTKDNTQNNEQGNMLDLMVPTALANTTGTASSANLAPDMTINTTEPLTAIGDLAQNIGNYPAPFTKEELAKLVPYITTVSQSPEVYTLKSGVSGSRMLVEDIMSDPIAVWKKLAEAYPEKDQTLLMQYAANISDYFDEDKTPTVFYTDSRKSLSKTIIGVEATAFVTEVYPDSTTPAEKGDKGQFVELYNPWQEVLRMPGWRIDIYGVDGSMTGSVTISTTIPPGGCLVVTDHFRKQNENDTGGLYEIFGVSPSGGLYQVYENKGLDLPDLGGGIVLRDEKGNLIDTFRYASTGAMDSLISFQRSDPTVRVATMGSATPFVIPALAQDGQSSYIKSMSKMRAEYGDAGCSSPLELLRVSSSYGNADTKAAKMWQMPVYNQGGSSNSGADKTNFDQSIIDLVVAGDPVIIDNGETSATYTRGKLNVNTCSNAALLSIDARVDGLLVMTPQLWNQLSQRRASAQSANVNAFASCSDFVCAVIPSIRTQEEFEAAARVLDQICVSSASYLAKTESAKKSAGKSDISGKQYVILAGDATGVPGVESVNYEW